MLPILPRHQDISEGIESSSVQITTLSLFFLLLVFFMLMNSISEFSKKSHEILKSMRQAFGSDSISRIEVAGIAPELTLGMGTGMTIKDLGGLFRNEVPGLKAAEPSRAGVLSITLPANEFNQLLGISGSRRVSPELRTMLDFIQTYPKVEYRLQLLKNVRPDVFAQGSRRLDPALAYLVMWADTLPQLGLPRDKFEYGVAAGPAGTVTLRIIAVRDLATENTNDVSPTVVVP